MSFEYNNFLLTLTHLAGIDVIERPFDVIPSIGKEAFNKKLLMAVEKEKPDLLFVFMYTDEIDPKILKAIRARRTTKIVAWFADDYWRFFNYSRRWAPYFDLAVTTSPQAFTWYRHAGFTNAALSQWACNTDVYKPRERMKDIDVSFVGQYKRGRGEIIDALHKNQIAVQAYGFGWPARTADAVQSGGPNGRVSQEEMLNIFSRSRINLNLNVRPGRWEPAVLARIFLRKSINHLVPDIHFVDNLRAWWHFAVPHTHARPFELAGCRAFTISGYSEGIGDYYEPDREMVFYRDIDDLVQKIRYYLSHNEEREKIAQAGYERTMRDHTYQKRFKELFAKIGILPA